MAAAAVLAKVKARNGRTGRGVSLASDYALTLAHVFRPLGGKTATDYDARLKLAEAKLVYRDDPMEIYGGIKTAAADSASLGVASETWGKADAGSKATPGAAMDFDCVLTSKRKDRDRDILHPKGATLDERMPLLWQHLPDHPIGKMTRTIARDEDSIRVGFAIVDTPFGRDAAQLVEFGALRISHGFNPVKYSPLEAKGSDEFDGFDIEEYEVMEGSLVSIPSNTDAVVEQFSRGKLHHPWMKGWAKGISDKRPDCIVGGWDAKAAADAAAALAKGAGAGGNVVNIAIGNGGTLDAAALAKMIGDLVAKGMADLEAKLKPAPKKKGKKDEGDGPDATNADSGTDATETDDPVAEEGEAESIKLDDILAMVEAVAKDSSLPKEAADRVGLMVNMLGTIAEKMEERTAAINEASSAQDVGAIMASVGDMVTDVVAALTTLSDEALKVAAIPDVSEASVQGMQDVAAQVDLIREALEGLTDAAENVDDGTGGEGDEPAEAGGIIPPEGGTDDGKAAETDDKSNWGVYTCTECLESTETKPEDCGFKCPSCGADWTSSAGNYLKEGEDEDKEDDEEDEEEGTKGTGTIHCKDCSFSSDNPEQAQRHADETGHTLAKSAKAAAKCPKCGSASVSTNDNDEALCRDCGHEFDAKSARPDIAEIAAGKLIGWLTLGKKLDLALALSLREALDSCIEKAQAELLQASASE